MWPRAWVLALTWAPPAGAELPIFDAYPGFSYGNWGVLAPADAVALLRQAGVKCALVSSSGDDRSPGIAVESAPSRAH
jgi:hypothetical protein